MKLQTKAPPTPLPRSQAACVVFIQFCEGINISVLFPFMAFMVEEFGYSGKSLGYYVGGLAASFCAAQFFSSVLWGKISDKYGRKPAIISGTFGAAFGMFIFGSATTYTQAVIGRMVSGFLSGNLGVLKSYLTEFTDDSNRAMGFSLMSLSSAIASVIAPLAGGLLCKPATNFPAWFPPGSLFFRLPYLLPCLLCVVFNVLSTAFCAVYMEETRKPSPSSSSSSSSSSKSSFSTTESSDQIGDGTTTTTNGRLHRYLSKGKSLLSMAYYFRRDQQQKTHATAAARQDSRVSLSSRLSYAPVSSIDDTSAVSWDSSIDSEAVSPVAVAGDAQCSASGDSPGVEMTELRVIKPDDRISQQEGGLSRRSECESDADDDDDDDDDSKQWDEGDEECECLMCASRTADTMEYDDLEDSTATTSRDAIAMSPNSVVSPISSPSTMNRDTDTMTHGISKTKINNSVERMKQTPRKRTLPPALRRRVVLLATGNYGLLAMAFILLEETIPLFLKLDRDSSGFSFTSTQIGLLLSICGGMMMLFTAFLLPTIAAQSKAVLFRVGVYMAMAHLLLWPLLGVFNRYEIRPNMSESSAVWVVWPLLACVCVIKCVSATVAFTAVIIQISHCVHDDDLGAVNGLGQSLASLARAVGPAIGGALWSVSMSVDFIFLNFIVSGLVMVGTIYVAALMPASLDYKKSKKKTSKKIGEDEDSAIVTVDFH